MSFLVANLPVTPVWVKKEYLYDLEIEDNKLKGEGELVEGTWVTVKSKPGRALLFETLLLEYGALYDIKTCNDYKWQSIFGKYGKTDGIQNYMVQLGTYGLYFRENGIKINKMALLFYNKNNSRVKDVRVPRSYIDMAERYWLKVNESFKEGLPPIERGLAPVLDWECNKKYCSFFEACGGGIKGLD